jgi:dethiobiotin synthetase
MEELNMQKHTLFVTGIDTEIGKTIISSILVQALKADYWKPVQAGDLDNSDTMKVQRLVSNSKTKFYPEGYRLNHPMSPHAAADLDGVSIKLTDFDLPNYMCH